MGEGKISLNLLNHWRQEQFKMAGKRKGRLVDEKEIFISKDYSLLSPTLTLNEKKSHDKSNQKRKFPLAENLEAQGTQKRKVLAESISNVGDIAESKSVTFDQAWEAVEQVKCSLDLVHQYAKSRMSKTLNSRALIGLRNLMKINDSLDSIKEFIEDCDEVETRNESTQE